MTTGKKIKTARILAGLTQAQLAGKSGLHQPYISAIENDRHNISKKLYDKLIKICVK